MKLKPRLTPGLIGFSVILLFLIFRLLHWEALDRVERFTYDTRVKIALWFHPAVATDLGFLYINEESIKRVQDGSLGFNYGLLWPRQVYGRALAELAQQGAKAVALDIIFGELRPDHAGVQLADGNPGPESDQFFADEMRKAGSTILAVTKQIYPPPYFVTNALAIGDITTERDQDGVLRRVQIVRPDWHLAFRQLADACDLDLDAARIERTEVVLPPSRRNKILHEPIRVPLDEHGEFDLEYFVGEKIPPGMARKSKPVGPHPIWHMGVVLAAEGMGIDLTKAQIDLEGGRVTLHAKDGAVREIPVDSRGYAYVDWSLPADDPRLTRESFHDLLAQAKLRLEGNTNDLSTRWSGKLVVIGSSAQVGNNLTDRGATPMESDTILVSKHWNVANSIIVGRFVSRSDLVMDLALICILALMCAAVALHSRVVAASSMVALIVSLYFVLACVVFVQTRYWMPVILPIAGGLFVYAALLTWRVVFEQAGQRRVKAVLATIVSPKIAQLLLKAERLVLGGARREVTVLFADVRGFTEFTDASQQRAEEYVRQQNLSGADAEEYYAQQARESLDTINRYLGLFADTLLQHDGTFDKFIGDCVMAFWGDPTPNPRHASACVHAAIAAQRAVDELNRQRQAYNKALESENKARIAAGLPLKSPLAILYLGTGINTGIATVGLMGSEVKTVVRQGNYTVFGREVNLASRLEGLSGRGRIIISESTYQHLQRDDPALAATCLTLEPTTLKGFRSAVQVYEVPWSKTETLLSNERHELGKGKTVLLAFPHSAEQ